MEMDYFSDEQGQTITYPQNTTQNTSQNNQQTDQFQYINQSQPQYQQQLDFSYNQASYSASNTFQQDQIARKVREQEQRINEQLRAKANKQYEEKNNRKQKGRQDLQQFFAMKQKNKEQRKKKNLEQQQELAKNKNKTNEQSSWMKVASNIKIKQGQYVGTKDVNRMRQAIIRKRDDERR